MISATVLLKLLWTTPMGTSFETAPNIDGLPVAAWLSDPEGKLVQVNQPWLAFTGESDTTSTKSWTDGIHEEDSPSVTDAWKTALNSKSPFAVSYRNRRPDGTYGRIKLNAMPCFDSAGELAAFIGILADASAEHEALEQAQQELQSVRAKMEVNEQRFRSLLDALPCHVYQLDAEGHVEFVNEHWLEYSGLTLDEVQADSQQILVHPDDLAELQRFRVAQSNGESFDSELRLRRSDGVYRWHMARTVPVRVNGQITEWVGANIDIDDRKRREEVTQFFAEAGRVLSQDLDLDSTLNTITSLAVPRLADWCRIDLVEGPSKVRRTAYSNADPARMAMAAAAKERLNDMPDRHEPVFEWVVSTGESVVREFAEPLVAELLVRRPELESIVTPFEFRSAIMVAIKHGARTLGALTLATAESGRRLGKEDLPLAEEFAHRFAMAIENALLYENLASAVQAKDEFLALVSHELRTPLTTLTGTARALRRHGDKMLQEDRIQALKDIEFGAEWLARIVENMLTLAHAENQGAAEFEPQLLRRIIGALLEEQREQFPGHEVVLTAPEDVFPVSANAGYIRQIVGNLLSNARKYSPFGSRIDVVIERDGNFAAVTISDRGIGLKQEQLEEVFQPFFRSREGSARASGIGLGLTVCKRFVELQGGAIGASAREGGGSSFRFTLPLALDGSDEL